MKWHWSFRLRDTRRYDDITGGVGVNEPREAQLPLP